MRRVLKICVTITVTVAIVIAVGFYLLIYPRKTIAPILMYHSVSSLPSDLGYPQLSADLFKKQLDFLSRHHYRTVSLKALIDYYTEKKKVPAGWVVLTFDDGYTDFYTQVYPILKQYGFQATVFVSPGRIEEYPHYMTWQQLQQLARDDSIEIGSHSLMHDPLNCLSSQEAYQRMKTSKKILEDKIGKPVSVFAYPFGALSADIKGMIPGIGYTVAVGTVQPRGAFPIRDIYNLRRVYISGIAGYPFVFRFMLSGYYPPARALVLKLLNIKGPRDAADCIFAL
jgi:peptidoglycan/xylan/chitin deacetylase (PgdA/CDA1 family)